jgi:hypothetical protein
MNFLSKIDKFEKGPLFKIGKLDISSLLMNDGFLESYLKHKSLGVTNLNEAHDIYTAE